MNKKVLAVSIAVIISILSVIQVFAYSDTSDHWAKDTIDTLSEKGIISGYPDGTFLPEGTIQVDEFIKAMVSMKGYKLPNGSSYWASTYIDTAKNLDLITDRDFYTFDRPITRQEMAKIVIRAVSETYSGNINAYADKIKDFNNIPTEFQPYVLKAYSKGIITGTDDGTFKGSNNATRAEAATIILRLIDQTKRVVPK